MDDFKLSDLPFLESKPRESGITMVMDRGLSVREAEDLVSNRAEMIDLVKFPWGSAYVLGTDCVKTKLEIYKSAEIDVFIGGTFFEAVAIRGQVRGYLSWLQSLGIDLIEVSDGSVPMTRDEKTKYISDFSGEGFKVISEVGSKDAEADWSSQKWIDYITGEINAGAWKVIIEGRGYGNAGIYDATGKIRVGIVDSIAGSLDPTKLIWEAPAKDQQDYLINRFGANVNIGNVQPVDVVALRAMRLGLRGDTLFSFFRSDPK